MQTVVVYSDYKSPYAYLAKDLVYALARDCGVKIDWLPYVLDIPSYLGSAELDASGKLVAGERNAHQWRRVRYSYMDCRREANKRGLVILGTRKIWDSSLAAIGMLWAKWQGDGALTAYHDSVFERFWRRELDIEDSAAIKAVLREAGADIAGFDDYVAGAGRREREAIQAVAEEAGVFGVPSLIVDGELFWGREHLPAISERLRATA